VEADAMKSDPVPALRLASWTLPARDREILLADLWEESAGQPRRLRWVAGQALRLAAHLHAECYRDPGDVVRLLALLITGAALLAIVQLPGFGTADGTRYFTDPVTRAILAFWSASHLTSALAAGLVIGRVALPQHLAVGRWHVVMVLAVLHGMAAGVTGALALAGAAVLADRARRSLDSSPEARPGASA
jgi:hypothetical protein